jgi:hypothetical protein
MNTITIDTNFQTPVVVCDFMASMINGKGRLVLEPTPVTGRLVKSIQNNGHLVYFPDSDYWYMDHGVVKTYDYTVMNPPFSPMSEGYRYLQDAMKRSEQIIALLPWFIIINSERRLNDIKEWGLKSVTALPRKTFPGTRIQCCIIEMDNFFGGTTEFKTFSW